MSYSQGRSQGFANVGGKWQRSLADVLEVWDGEKYVTMFKDTDVQAVPLVTSSIQSLDMSSAHTMTETEMHADVLVLTGALTANRQLTLYVSGNRGKKKYHIINKCTYSGSTPYSVVISAGGATASLPALKSTDETAIQSYYTTDIYCDGTDVYADGHWRIDGSNANGSYVKSSDGTMECWMNDPSATDGKVYTFPVAFLAGSIPVVSPTLYRPSYLRFYDFIELCLVSNTTFRIITTNSVGASANIPLAWRAIGRWK